MSVAEPGELREPGEQFRFIAQIEQIFPDDSYDGESDKLNLITTTGKYGIIFIACKTYIRAFKTKDLIDQSSKSPVSTINCKGSITHISTSCDGLTLFVVTLINYSPFGYFYDVCHSLQTGKEPVPFYSTPLSTSVGARVTSLSWNPSDPACIAVALSTGDLSLLKIKESSVEFTNKNGIGANAVTWSAKGKQLAVGKKDATLSLFKPDLTFVRSIEAPKLADVGPIIDITWFTNCEFFIVYLTMNTIPALMYVNGPKGKPANFTNFEDVCYSNENGKPVSYYTKFLSEWNLLFAFSSHGVEMGVIGKSEKNQGECKWCVWLPDEGARAAMNFYEVKHETFPLGLTIDFTSQKIFSSKDDKQNGPFPFLVTISTKGQLNVFFIENKLKDVQPLTIPCESLPLSGHRTPEQFGQPSTPIQQEPPPEPPQPVELKQNSLSAFSSIPKKNDAPTTTLPLFSTPVKPTSAESYQGFKSLPQQLFSLPSSTYPNAPPSISIPASASTQFSFGSGGTDAASKPMFGTPFTPKPVSLSSQIGTSSLPAPSPQKSELLKIVIPTIATTQPQNLLPVSSQPTTPSVPKSPITPKVSKDGILLHIQKEQQQFDREIAELHSINEALEYEVGSKEEDLNLRTSLENVKEWMNEMKSTTGDQSDEVGLLHQKTLEAMATYEEAHSHKETKFNSRNQMYLQLRSLDPCSQRKLDEVRVKYQYLTSQMMEANTKLDFQWEEYSTLKNPKKLTRDQRSDSDNLYRSVLKLHNARVNSEKEIDIMVQKLNKINIHPIRSFNSICINSESNLEYLGKALNSSQSKISSQSPQDTNSPNKIRILKEVLSQRAHTPVRVHSASKITPSADKKMDQKENLDLEINQNIDASKHSSQVKGNINSLHYEDVSPPTSPPKSSSTNNANPLAALSSLVGNVSTPSLGTPVLSSATGMSNLTDIDGVKSGTSTLNFYSSVDNKVEKPMLLFENKESDVNPTISVPSLDNVSAFSAVPSLQIGSKSSLSQPLQPKINFQGFGTMSFSHPASTSGVTISTVAPPLESQNKSTLTTMLNTSLASSPTTQTNSGNLSNFLKGNTSMPMNLSTSSFPTSDTKGSLFSSIGGLSSSANNIFPKLLSSQESATETKPINLDSKPSSPNGIQTSLSVISSISKENNVLCSNPILSSQILKETSAISASKNSSQTSSSFGTLLTSNSEGMTSGNDFKIKQELGLNFKLPVPTISSDSVTKSSTFSSNTSSLFSQPSSSTSLFGQTSSLFVVPTTNTTSTTPNEQSSGNSSLFSQLKSNLSVSEQTTSVSLTKSPTVVKSLFFQTTTSLSISQPPSTSSLFSQTPTGLSIFSQPSSTTSVFAQPSKNSIFNMQPTNTSMFGGESTAAISPSSDSKLNFSFAQTSLTTSTSLGNTTNHSSTNIPSEKINKSIFSTNLAPKTSATGNLSPSEPFSGSISSSFSLFGAKTSGKLDQETTDRTTSETETETKAPSSSLFGGPLESGEQEKKKSTTDQGISVSEEKVQCNAEAFSGSLVTTPSQTFNSTSTSTTSDLGKGASFLGQSIFSKSTENSIPSFSVGQTSNSSSVFGQASSSGSLFGPFSLGSSTPTTTITTTTTAQSVFGTGSSKSLFGNLAANGISQTGSVVSSAPSQSIFKNLGSGSAFQSSPFGTGSAFSQSTAASTTNSGFNQTTTTTVMSPFFGQTTTTESSSVFGQANTTGGTGSIFGQSNTTGGTGSTFGQAIGKSGSSSVFGQVTTTATDTIFGQTSSVGTPGSSSGVFGTPPPSVSIFGGQSNANFGQPSKSSGNTIFGNSGGQTNSSSIFGGGSATTQSSAFGANQPNSSSMFSSNFGGQNSGGLFSGSSMFGGLGKPPNKEDASKNVFGIVKSETNPQTNIFGGASSSPFNSNKSPSTPGGAFSPVKSESSSSFGFRSSSAFGSSPNFGDANKNRNVFGGGPVFGGGATFGASPTISSGPAAPFGVSNSTVNSGSGGFGSFAASSGGATFGALAGGNNNNQSQTGSSEPTGFGQLFRQASGSGLPDSSSIGGSSSFTNWR